MQQTKPESAELKLSKPTDGRTLVGKLILCILTIAHVNTCEAVDCHYWGTQRVAEGLRALLKSPEWGCSVRGVDPVTLSQADII